MSSSVILAAAGFLDIVRMVFNCLVLDFPKDQKDLTICIPLFIVLCSDLYSSLLVSCCSACNYAFMFCELLCFFFLFHSTTCW